MLYQRLPRRLDDLAVARVAGSDTRLLARLAKVRLLILDDWGMAKLTAEQRRDLMEVIDDRHQRASTVVAAQLPLDRWHDRIGDPTDADAILDRLVHNAYRIELRGESMRKRRGDPPAPTLPVGGKDEQANTPTELIHDTHSLSTKPQQQLDIIDEEKNT